MKINYNHLRYFWQVAKEGNLTRSAKKLNLSQSALSAQIKTLEAQLGLDLFHRVGKRLELTEPGRLVLDYAEAIYKTGDELLSHLSLGVGTGERILRVGAVSTLSRNFQTEFLRPLWTMEGIQLVLESGTLETLIQRLEHHLLDAVLTNTMPIRDAQSHVVAHRLSEQPVGLVGAPSGPYKGRSLEDLLASEPLILPTVESNIRLALDAYASRKGLRPHIAAEVSDMTMLRLLAREHIGLALVPLIVVKEELERGILKEIVPLPDMKETFHAVTLKRRFPNPLLGRLFDISIP